MNAVEFLAITPGVEFKMSKEFKENIVLDFGVGVKEAFRIDKSKFDKIKNPSIYEKADVSKLSEEIHKHTTKDHYLELDLPPVTEVKANIGLTYNF